MVRIYLSGLLLVMATGQLLDLRGFVEIIETYRFGPAAFGWPIALGLVSAEIAGAVGMLGYRRWRPAGATITLAVAVFWTLLAVQAFVRGLQLDNCGCFGVYFAQELRWYILVQDAFFIAAAAWVWSRSTTWTWIVFQRRKATLAHDTARPTEVEP